jgi:CBS domain-containing protein
MIARELISEVVPSLKTSDSGLKALYWMDIFRISHLPIVNNSEFLGLISDKDIYDLNMADEPIGNHELSLVSPSVKEEQHIFEVIEVASKLKLTVVPVLDSNNKYLGAVTMNEMIEYIAQLSALNQPGGILVLELHENDYTMSQIAQIIESNDAKILSLYVKTFENSTKVELTIKINRTDLTSIIQTFERYDYMIKASYMHNQDVEELYENRYESFLKYLSI